MTQLTCHEIGDSKLEVLYGDRKLEKLCTDEREMRRRRSDIADRLRLRIKALEAADTVGELPLHDPLGDWHPLTADLKGLWASKLGPSCRLLVRPEGAEDASTAVTATVIEISAHYGH